MCGKAYCLSLCVLAGNTTIQPLSEAEGATLQAAQAVPGLQDLTLQDILETHSVEPKQDQLEVQQRVDEADELLETRGGGEDMQNKQRTTGEEALSMRNISNILLTVERVKELQDHETCRQRYEIILELDQLFRYYTKNHKEEVNKRWQTLITTFFRQNVLDGDDQEGEEEEEGDLDDVASVMSPLDFEGFLEEVERSDTVGGEWWWSDSRVVVQWAASHRCSNDHHTLVTTTLHTSHLRLSAKISII